MPLNKFDSMQDLFEQSFSSLRLTLQPLVPNDAIFIQQLTNSSGWIKFIGDRNIHSKEDAELYIQKIIDMPQANYWKVVVKKSEEPVGVITLIKRDYLDDYDVGYALLPSAEGKGFAFEGTEVILKKALQKSIMGKIYAVTKKANSKSINLLTKLGLSYSKTLDLDGDVVALYEIVK